METINVRDLDFCDEKSFHNLLSLVDFEQSWNAQEWNASEIKEIFRGNMYNENGQLLAAFPIPDPPTEYDPFYRPDFIVIQAVGEEIYGLIDEMESSIDEDMVMIYGYSISIGIVGLTVVLLVSWVVAAYLTRPLNWMMDVCQQIVRHSDEKSDSSIYGRDEEKPLVRCAPKTEITALVSAFQSIIENFSGNGPATVALPEIYAVYNKLTWKEDFGVSYLEKLYESPPATEMSGQMEQRLSFVSSVVSHQSTATLDLDEELSDEGNDTDEKVCIIPDVDTGLDDRDITEEQPTLASVLTPSIEPVEIDETAVQCMKQEGTGPHPEEKMPEKPPHLLSCSEGNRSNYGNITTTLADDADEGRFENELRSSINHKQMHNSPLFWWIMGLIVVPLLLTMALILTTVTINVTSVLPTWYEYDV